MYIEMLPRLDPADLVLVLIIVLLSTNLNANGAPDQSTRSLRRRDVD